MRRLALLLLVPVSEPVDLAVFGGGAAVRAVRVGIPFEPGEVREPRRWIVEDLRGRARPTQARVAERWADGSIRWLQVEFEGAPGLHRLSEGIPPEGRVLSLDGDAREVRIAGRSLEASFPSKGEDLVRLALRGSEVRARVSMPPGSAPVRSVVAETGGAFRVDVRCVEAGGDGLVATIRFRVQEALPSVEFEAVLSNRSGEPRLLEGAALHWSGGRPPRKIRVHAAGALRALGTGSLPLSIVSRKEGTALRTGRRSLPRVAGVCGIDASGGSFGLAIHRFAERFPAEIRLSADGSAAVPFLVEGGVLDAGKAVAIQGALLLGVLDDEGVAAIRRRTRALPGVERWRLLAGPLEAGECRTGGASRVADALLESARALVAGRERGGRDFGDFRLSDRVWSNLEYDTALGLLLLAARTGDPLLLEAADDALFHWRVVDRIHGGAESPAAGFPYQHAPDHALPGGYEVGHAWIEGAIAAWRLTGDPEAAEDALLFGEALLRLAEGSTLDTERIHAWPIIAFAALADAFPGRGFGEALESRMDVLLSREAGNGSFVFASRRDPEAGTFEVSVWLQGGLLLEALSKYAAAGGRRDVAPVADRTARRLAADGFDARRNRIHDRLVYGEAGGMLVGRRGALDPSRALYAASGLLRACGLTGRNEHAAAAAEWLEAVEPRMPGVPDRHPANSLSLSLRALVPVLRGRGGRRRRAGRAARARSRALFNGAGPLPSNSPRSDRD